MTRSPHDDPRFDQPLEAELVDDRPLQNHPLQARLVSPESTQGSLGATHRARVVPPSRRRSGWWWAVLIVGLGTGFLLLVATAVLTMLGQDVRELFTSREPLPAFDETPAAKYKNVAYAFTTPSQDVPRDVQQKVHQATALILHSATSGDVDNVLKHVDVSRYIQQVASSKYISSLSITDRLSMRMMFSQTTDGPAGCDEFRIRNILPLGKTEVLVYLFLWDDPHYVTEARWWMIRRGSEWKLYDWEELRGGISESDVTAAYIEGHESTLTINCHTVMNGISEAVYLVGEGKRRQAREKLQELGRLELDPALNDSIRYYLAQYAAYSSHHEDVDEHLAKMVAPNLTPGYYYLTATTALELREPTSALEAIDRFEQLMGVSPAAMTVRAEALTQLQRIDDAMAEWRHFLDFFPADTSALMEVARLLPPPRTDEIAPLLDHGDCDLDTLRGLASVINPHEQPELLAALSNAITKKDPHSASALYLHGLQLTSVGQITEAAEAYRSAARLELQPDARRRYQTEYVRAMVRLGRIGEVLQNVIDRPLAFRALAAMARSERIDADKWLPIAAAYHHDNPNDPEAVSSLARTLYQLKRFEEASAVLQPFLRPFDQQQVSWSPDDDEAYSDEYDEDEFYADDLDLDDDVVELGDARGATDTQAIPLDPNVRRTLPELRRLLANVVFHQGNSINALATLQPADEYFSYFAQLCVKERDTIQLRKLLDAYRGLTRNRVSDAASEQRDRPFDASDSRLDSANIDSANIDSANIDSANVGGNDEAIESPEIFRPELTMFEAKLAWLDGDHERAWKLLQARAESLGTDPSNASSALRRLHHDYAIQSAHWPELYATAAGDERDSLIQELVSEFTSRNRWQDLLRLTELPSAPAKEQLFLARVQALSHLGRYADVVAECESARDEPWFEDLGWTANEVCRLHFRSCLQIGSDTHRQVAQENFEETHDSSALVVSAAIEGDRARLDEYLRRLARESHGTLQAAYFIDDAVSRRKHEFADLWHTYPTRLPYDHANSSITLCFEGSWQATETTMTDLGTQLAGVDGTTNLLPVRIHHNTGDPVEIIAIAVQRGDLRFVVTPIPIALRPTTGGPSVPRYVDEFLKTSSFNLAINVVLPDDSAIAFERSLQLARDISRWLQIPATAVYAWDEEKFAMNPDATVDWLDHLSVVSFVEQAIDISLTHDDPGPRADDTVAQDRLDRQFVENREMVRGLQRAYAQYCEQPDGRRIVVQVDLQLGSLTSTIDVDLERIEIGSYTAEFNGVVTHSHPMLFYADPGTLVRFQDYQIRSWRPEPRH